MKITILFRMFLVAAIVVNCKGYEPVQQTVSMNFTTNLYPTTPMKNVQALTMKLWGYVDGARAHPEILERFVSSQEQFAQQIVSLHSMLDVLLLSLEKQVYDCPDCVVQALQDFEHIFGGLKDIQKQYEILMVGIDNYFIPIVEYLLSSIIIKIKKVLDTGHISTPLYAFFLRYSKVTTPLFPPANMVPVAPMA